MKAGLYYNDYTNEFMIISKVRWVENTYNDPYFYMTLETKDEVKEFRVNWAHVDYWKEQRIGWA